MGTVGVELESQKCLMALELGKTGLVGGLLSRQVGQFAPESSLVGSLYLALKGKLAEG